MLNSLFVSTLNVKPSKKSKCHAARKIKSESSDIEVTSGKEVMYFMLLTLIIILR